MTKLTRVFGWPATALALLLFFDSGAHAQRVFTLGLGAGAGVGEGRGDIDRSHTHGLGFIELKPPLLPFGARANALVVSGVDDAGGPVALTASALAVLPLPVVMPYALAGWGRYGIRGNDSRDGWHVGAGIRIMRLFVEVQRHERLDRNLLTFGITF